MSRLAVLLLALCASAARAADAAPATLSRSAQAGGATVTVTASSAQVRTGQPIEVEFRVDRPTDVSVVVPSVPQTLEAWDVRAARSLPTDPAAPDRVIERLTLVTFESGEVNVPSLTFTLRAKDGTETKLASPTLPVNVSSLLAEGFDPARIRDVKGAVDMPLESRWPWMVTVAAMVAALCWLAWRWWKGRTAAEAEPEPCDLRALRELDDLAARQLPQKGLVLDFYVLLSDTVRRYVEGRFGLRAPEQTTKEFLQAARHHPAMRDDHQRMLAAFLRAADMVKFAAQRPGPAECERGLDAARGFVRESAPATDEGGHTPDRPPAHEGSESAR